MNIRLCKECGQGCDKDFQCHPLKTLYKVYQEKRVEEKRTIIQRLREKLQLVDYELAPDIEKLAKKIIKKFSRLHFINGYDIKIGYVRSYENKNKNGRATFAECRKVTPPYSAYLPYDFIITVYEPNMAWLSDNQKKIVVYHELRHIGMGRSGFIVNPHDTEDFNSILAALGLYWSEPGFRQ
jgi:predicted metallopeptidase